MRPLLLIPATSLAVAALGAAACLLTGLHPHPHEMTLALLIATPAALAGLAPLLATRGATQIAVSQASLAGSILHMFLTLALAVAALLAGLVPARGPFLAWLLAFYWTTLAVVVSTMASAIRHAPTESSTPTPAVKSSPAHG